MMNFSSRAVDRLPHRLRHIRNCYENQDYVWDIGCDHGDIGISFLGHEKVKGVHLVDPSGPVIENLIKKIGHIDSYITKELFFKIIQKKGQNLKINTRNNCIFIAGMGGKMVGEIVESLYPQLSPEDLVVISPHRAILELRTKLNALSIKLINEEVIKEGKQFYQILTLKKIETGSNVSLYGEQIWHGSLGEEYKNDQIKHFTHHQDVASLAYVEHLRSL